MYTVISKEALESLTQYFNILENTGYFRYDMVFKILMLLMADEWLNSMLNFYITEADYKLISSLVLCITGNCLIPYFQYKDSVGAIGQPGLMPGNHNRFRDTEDFILRFVERNSDTRLTEQYYNNTD